MILSEQGQPATHQRASGGQLIRSAVGRRERMLHSETVEGFLYAARAHVQPRANNEESALMAQRDEIRDLLKSGKLTLDIFNESRDLLRQARTTSTGTVTPTAASARARWPSGNSVFGQLAQ